VSEPQLQQLVTAATAGDALALDALLERYLPRVRAYLRVRAGAVLDKESVSDLAQSVCRDVLENIGRFRYDGEDGFRRWLFKTAQRKILDRYEFYAAARRDRRREQDAPAHDFAETLACYGALPSPSRDAAAREELARVERALDDLPDEQREVIVLAKIVGLSRAAIAAEMGRNEGAVRMLLHRALARLAERLTAKE
jgi:RNA polymerase sigma-70 factor (ECF subfamily)